MEEIPNNHLGCIKNPVNNEPDKLPTSTAAVFFPSTEGSSTVINSLLNSRCEQCLFGPFGVGCTRHKPLKMRELSGFSMPYIAQTRMKKKPPKMMYSHPFLQKSLHLHVFTYIYICNSKSWLFPRHQTTEPPPSTVHPPQAWYLVVPPVSGWTKIPLPKVPPQEQAATSDQWQHPHLLASPVTSTYINQVGVTNFATKNYMTHGSEKKRKLRTNTRNPAEPPNWQHFFVRWRIWRTSKKVTGEQSSRCLETPSSSPYIKICMYI